jgi:hypothetical protein
MKEHKIKPNPKVHEYDDIDDNKLSHEYWF